MEKLIEKLKKDAERNRSIACKLKEKNLMQSFQINMYYAYGIEYAIEQLKRKIENDKIS